MTRFWDRAAGVPIDAIGFGLLVVLLVAAAALAAAGWHSWPRWLPRRGWFDAVRRLLAAVARWRLPKWHLPRWRRRRRDRGDHPVADEPVAAEHDTLPDRPAAEFAGLADRLASQGRYAEAVRERLRAMVRQLVEAGIISHHPEWTVTELARAAVSRLPQTGPALQGASRVFSDIWYGQQPALATHDEQMRGYAADLRTHTATPVPAR